MSTKSVKNQSNKPLWTDVDEQVCSQTSGGGIQIGEPFPIDGLGRPIKDELVVSLALLFANPFS